jgi:hypothetical protein
MQTANLSENPHVQTEIRTNKNPGLQLEDLKARFETTDAREKDLFSQDFKYQPGAKSAQMARLEKAGATAAEAEAAIQMAISYRNYKDLKPNSIGFNVIHVNNQATIVVSGEPVTPSKWKTEYKMASAIGGEKPESDIHFYLVKTPDGLKLHERAAAEGPHRAAKS